MGILQLPTQQPGMVGILPNQKFMLTTDNLVTVTTPGYLNQVSLESNPISTTDILQVMYDFNPQTQVGVYDVFNVSITNGVIQLSVDTAISGVTYTAPSLANHLAVFTNASGNISRDIATAINGGNIQAGLSGTAGNLISFPSTAANGSLIVSALNAGGAFNTTIRNSVMGQSSVVSIPDPGAATANFLLSSSGGGQVIAGGLTISSGNLAVSAGTITSSGAITSTAGNITSGSAGDAGTFISFPAAAANGTLILAATNAGAAFNTTISNGTMGQSTVYTIPDAGSATANILVSKLSGTQHITSGAFQVDAGIISSGISTGGTAGSFVSYPATASNGSFALTPVGNAGNFASVISPVSTLGQASTYTLPDAGNAAARFLVGATATPFVSGNFPQNSGTGGLMVDSGIAVSALAQTANVVLLTPGADQTITLHNLIVSHGNLVAGSSGNAGTVTSFPGTAANGSLILAAVNAGGAFNMTISNGALGQSTVVSIPDPGATTANMILSKSAGTQDITSGSLQVDAGSITSGLSTGGFVGLLKAFPTTAASGFVAIQGAVNGTGNFGTTISNATTQGQSQVVTVPDVGAATGQFLAKTAALVSGNFPQNSGTAGLVVDSGLAVANIATTSTAVLLSPSGNQTITTNNLTLTLGNIVAAAGSINATLGAVTAGTTVTGATGVTATTGNMTASAGNVVAGASGAAGTLISFPSTAANGTLIVAATNAGGAFNTTISNGTMGQSTVYSMGDIGASTGGLVVATSAIRMKSVAGAAAAGGAAAQSFTDAFSTTGSNIVGNWNTQANAASVLKIVPGNGSFVVTSSADAGVGTFNYMITK